MFKPFVTRVRRSFPIRFRKAQLPKLRLRKITWRTILKIGIIFTAGVIILGIGLFAWYFKDLPRPGELRTRSASESTILYDRNGKQIYDISGDERRILVKADEIPDISKKATVAIEDKNFYSHHGIDFRGLIRGVIFRPLTGKGVQGGSTITQQYVKNALLSPKRSVIRKIKEVILSLELESIYSKDDILTLYLNEIPYGSNIYGIEAASQAYYGKSVKDKEHPLTLSEAATLAALPQSPTRYSPYGNHVDLLIARKNLVLDDMVKTGAVTQEQANQAKKETPLAAKDFAQKRDNFPAPHFVMYVREQLVAKYGEELVQRGGLRVTTTLDLDAQSLADDAVKNVGAKVLPRAKASNAGLVAIDPKTGQLLAMVGSVDYFDREHEGNFNVATGLRQPGSAGKPIVYATLFEGKWNPGSVVWDVQTDFNGYKPNNFDGRFHGPLTIRNALGNSYNIPAVKALQIEGIDNFIKNAHNMGITTLDDRKDAGLSLALGGGEVKLVDLTAAYSVLANNGDRNPLTSILKIQDSRGKTLFEWKPEPKQVIKPEIAYEISDILSDINAKKLTFGNLLGVLTVPNKTVAVKTGTTNGFKDAWTIGYTPSIVAGVWAGNNDGSEMDHGGGSTVSAPIWDDFMTKYLAKKDNEGFTRPDSVTSKTVDFLSGKNPTPASGQLIQDLFAPWQGPDGFDDVHVRVKVCKSNGKLATDDTPTDEVEERNYTKVHSEQPNNPAYEGPVQAYARNAGLSSDPPTDKCDLTFSDPKILISSPEGDSTVSGIFTVSAEVTMPPGSTGSVEFAIDDKPYSTDTSSPYTSTFDTADLSLGPHVISAYIRATNGHSAKTQITILVGADSTPPNEVSNVSLSPNGSGKAKASWTNPLNSDLNTVAIYASQSPGIQGAKIATVSAHPGDNQTTTLNGLSNNVINYITFIPVDKTGNTTITSKQYTVTPP
jgi:1A family penicillin-binding protein